MQLCAGKWVISNEHKLALIPSWFPRFRYSALIHWTQLSLILPFCLETPPPQIEEVFEKDAHFRIIEDAHECHEADARCRSLRFQKHVEHQSQEDFNKFVRKVVQCYEDTRAIGGTANEAMAFIKENFNISSTTVYEWRSRLQAGETVRLKKGRPELVDADDILVYKGAVAILVKRGKVLDQGFHRELVCFMSFVTFFSRVCIWQF